MSCFFQTLSNKYRSRQGSESIIEEQLFQWGLTGKFRFEPFFLKMESIDQLT